MASLFWGFSVSVNETEVGNIQDMSYGINTLVRKHIVHLNFTSIPDGADNSVWLCGWDGLNSLALTHSKFVVAVRSGPQRDPRAAHYTPWSLFVVELLLFFVFVFSFSGKHVSLFRTLSLDIRKRKCAKIKGCDLFSIFTSESPTSSRRCTWWWTSKWVVNTPGMKLIPWTVVLLFALS